MTSDGLPELGAADDLTGILMIINHSFLKPADDVIDSEIISLFITVRVIKRTTLIKRNIYFSCNFSASSIFSRVSASCIFK